MIVLRLGSEEKITANTGVEQNNEKRYNNTPGNT